MHNILLKMFLFFSMLLLCSFCRLKELFQVKNGLTRSLLFWGGGECQKIWVGRTTLNGEKKEDGLMTLEDNPCNICYIGGIHVFTVFFNF